MSMIVFPKPYHKPPAPTRFDKRTLPASAFKALRTLDPKGGGILNSAQSLVLNLVLCQVKGLGDGRVDDGVSKPDRNLYFAQNSNLGQD